MSDTHKNLVAALNGRTSRKVANNTRVRRLESGAVALTLHQTDILTANPDGSTTANSGGFRTVTTKGRLNEFLHDGLFIGQTAGVWYWHRRGGLLGASGEKPVPFADGDSIGPRGGLFSLAKPGDDRKARELARKINEYAKECAASVPLAHPGAGDCFYCQMVTAGSPSKLPSVAPVCVKAEPARVSLGDATANREHLLSHMAEGYVVPSLVYNALKECAAGDLILSATFNPSGLGGIARAHVIRSVRRYLKRRLALAGN